MVPLNRKFCVLLALLALVHPVFSDTDKIETPEDLIKVFYQRLFSDQPTSELPQIFAEPTTFASALKLPNLEGVQDQAIATKDVWDYFRKNKDVFAFVGIDPTQTVKKTKLCYCFIAFQNTATFFDGIFCIELYAPLSKHGKEGVNKQIRFPLAKNTGPTGPRYLIEETMISINGVQFDPSKSFDHNGNLYQQLGFIPENVEKPSQGRAK